MPSRRRPPHGPLDSRLCEFSKRGDSDSAAIYECRPNPSELLRLALSSVKIRGPQARSWEVWDTMTRTLVEAGAVIVEEIRKQGLSKEAVEKLHLSIGITHAMIEDPALFLPFGIHPLWLWGPRLVAAIAVVYLSSSWSALKRRFSN